MAKAAPRGLLCLVAAALLAALLSVDPAGAQVDSSSTLQNPTTVFATPGVKTVTLHACNARGCTDVQKTVTVLDPVPHVTSLAVPLQVGAGAPTVLQATATGRPPLSYRWVLTGPGGDTVLTGNPATWTPSTTPAAYLGRLEVQNGDGTAVSTFAATSVLSTFADVPPTYWAWRPIEILAARGVTGGCATGPLRYCPDNLVTRAQMAVFLLIAKMGAAYVPPACVAPRFSDVPCTSPFAPWINELAARGVTNGCGNGNYCPGDVVSREQMSVFLLATYEPAGYQPPPVGLTSPFLDVPYYSPYAPWIRELANRGITGGCGGGRFCPADPVNRAQMAVFLTGTFGLTMP